MKYLILILTMFLSVISFTQKTESVLYKKSNKTIYQVKKYSVARINKDNKYITWPKSKKTKFVAIINIDTIIDYNDNLTSIIGISIFSSQYQQYTLNDIVNKQENSKGDIFIEFESTDLYEVECSVKVYYYDNKIYLIIEYSNFAIKYEFYKNPTESNLELK